MAHPLTNIQQLQYECRRNALEHGFDALARDPGVSIALMHSELSEALEALREDNPPDKHCPNQPSLAIELADCVIRIMDFCEAHGLNLESAILDKMRFNEGREHKHGKKF